MTLALTLQTFIRLVPLVLSSAPRGQTVTQTRCGGGLCGDAGELHDGLLGLHAKGSEGKMSELTVTDRNRKVGNKVINKGNSR